MKKKILFVTATRADFGKLKSLIKITKQQKKFDVSIVVTGMHMLPNFGSTHEEIDKSFSAGVIKFKNQKFGDNLENVLTRTTKKFSEIVKKIKPHLIIVHGDRVESLACALVASLNHILTAHIEGGELSGTIDDTIRHTITKLSHIHFAGNQLAKRRITNMGERKESVFVIGSPDIDILLSKKLQNIESVKKKYDIFFKDYAILLWHPVTSDIKNLKKNTIRLIKFINNFNINFVVIYSNNDPGTKIIINNYKKYLNKKKCKVFKSIRFESFITLLKHSRFIIGNSSAGIYEAPVLGVPVLNVGNRQHKRLKSSGIKNISISKLTKNNVINFLNNFKKEGKKYFGSGNTDKNFLKALNSKRFWEISTQKYFLDKKNT